MPARRDAAPEPRATESVKDKADRYFAEQCRRLGPVEPAPEPRRPAGRGVRNAFNRIAKPEHA